MYNKALTEDNNRSVRNALRVTWDERAYEGLLDLEACRSH